MKNFLRIGIVFGLLALGYQNCAQNNDPSLFQFGTTTSASSGTTDILLESPVGAFDVSLYDSMISLGGNCQTGSALSHYIELKLQDSNNQPIALRDGSCPDCFSLINTRCEHGRYNAVIPVTCAAYRGQASSLYRVVGQLVTKDTAGNETRADTGAFDRFLQIAWGTGACAQ